MTKKRLIDEPKIKARAKKAKEAAAAKNKKGGGAPHKAKAEGKAPAKP